MIKLLPQKQLLDKLNNQKKQEIDSGLFLSRKVDQLREDLSEVQKNHDDTIIVLNQDFKDFTAEMVSKKGTLEKEIKELEITKKLLQEPLDEAWNDYHRQNDELVISQSKLLENESIVSKQLTEIETEKNKLSESVSRITQNEKDTEKENKEAVSLKNLSKETYQLTVSERATQSNTFEKQMQHLYEIQKEYEVYMQTLELKEKDLQDKEVEFINREKHIESQQVSLRIAYEKIKNYGTNNS